MFPIRDNQPTQNVPVVNNALIVINVVVFLLQLVHGGGSARYFYLYGLVPARYTVAEIARHFTFGQQAFSFLSFQFIHGGFLHILGNMWFLYIFGDNVEDHFGPVRYLFFYLVCGVASGVSHILVNSGSNAPVIGASGAIAGVMGAYFLLHPKARVLTLIPIFIFPWFVEIPAFFFLVIWFLIQVFNASGGGGAVAWWAHIGGFLFGMVLLKLIGRVPASGLTGTLRKATEKRRTDRLQVVRPSSATTAEHHFHGTLDLTPYESFTGTHKLVNIPQGFHRRLIRVKVPPGVNQGTRLRLRGLGKPGPDGMRGDLYLTVNILTRPQS
jgi:rhomboid family protein